MLRRELAHRDDLAERFYLEARTIAHLLPHPNIVGISEAGITADGRVYYVMELLAGESLRHRLATLGTLTPRTAAKLVLQLLNALAAVHASQLVHRDVKPENIFWTRDGLIKLLDFGVVKSLYQTPAPGKPLTAPGVVLGTPMYMAPEYVLGRPIDARADLYSVGIIFWEALTGKPPFASSEADLLRTLYSSTGKGVPLVGELGPLPPDVDRFLRHHVLHKATRKDPAERYGSAEAFARDVRAVLERLPRGRREGHEERLVTRESRRSLGPEPGPFVPTAVPAELTASRAPVARPAPPAPASGFAAPGAHEAPLPPRRGGHSAPVVRSPDLPPRAGPTAEVHLGGPTRESRLDVDAALAPWADTDEAGRPALAPAPVGDRPIEEVDDAPTEEMMAPLFAENVNEVASPRGDIVRVWRAGPSAPAPPPPGRDDDVPPWAELGGYGEGEPDSAPPAPNSPLPFVPTPVEARVGPRRRFASTGEERAFRDLATPSAERPALGAVEPPPATPATTPADAASGPARRNGLERARRLGATIVSAARSLLPGRGAARRRALLAVAVMVVAAGALTWRAWRRAEVATTSASASPEVSARALPPVAAPEVSARALPPVAAPEASSHAPPAVAAPEATPAVASARAGASASALDEGASVVGGDVDTSARRPGAGPGGEGVGASARPEAASATGTRPSPMSTADGPPDVPQPSAAVAKPPPRARAGGTDDIPEPRVIAIMWRNWLVNRGVSPDQPGDSQLKRRFSREFNIPIWAIDRAVGKPKVGPNLNVVPMSSTSSSRPRGVAPAMATERERPRLLSEPERAARLAELERLDGGRGQKALWRLYLVREGGDVELTWLTDGQYVLGSVRSAGADLVFEQPGVAPRHARLWWGGEPAGWWLRDEGSAGGTRLQGALVTADVRLAAGDTIELGAVRLRVGAGDDDAPPVAAGVAAGVAPGAEPFLLTPTPALPSRRDALDGADEADADATAPDVAPPNVPPPGAGAGAAGGRPWWWALVAWRPPGWVRAEAALGRVVFGRAGTGGAGVRGGAGARGAARGARGEGAAGRGRAPCPQ